MPFYDLILNGVMFPQIKSKIVSWHPDVATQLCLSSEDDHTPVIQLWDLRYATSPVKQLENHTRYLSFFKNIKSLQYEHQNNRMFVYNACIKMYV